ncbi:N-alpha-acetyltransferase 40 [Coccomyxa sp. Obi]|nr:N-alpha-acetyltransferase 40 [Coccomyxa sp. Obi]
MGKKSIKGKERKQQRKAENGKIIGEQREIADTLRHASEVKDLLKEYPAFQQYGRNGLSLILEHYWAEDMPQATQEWALALCKSNMEEMYNRAKYNGGWNSEIKLEELAAPEARFLVAYQKVNDDQLDPVAFVHFRWESEDSVPVLYCYEIQLEAAVQRKGLGRFLMKFLELIARKAGMHEVMLTVLKANTAAAAMYAKLGYVPHETSPLEEEQEDYTILTKRLVAPAPVQQPLRAVTNSFQLENIIFGS